MLRSRLFWKLYAGFSLLILVTALIVWAIGSRRVENSALAEIRRSLLARATLFVSTAADRLPDGPDEHFQAFIQFIGQSGEARLTVISESGQVLGDSRESPAAMENHSERPEIREAKSTGEAASSIRHSRTLRHDMMYLAFPFDRGDGWTGFIRIALPLTTVKRRLDEMRRNVTLAGLVGAGVSLLLGALLFRLLTRPIVRMTRVARAVADGEYGIRVSSGSRDEIGRLGQSIQRMSDQLQERLTALTRERNQLRAILRSMLEGVIAVDREERVVHLNEVAAELLQSPVKKSIDLRIWELVRVQEISDLLAGVLNGEGNRSREVRLPKRLGERVVEMHASPLKDGSGTIFGAVLVLHDVSRLRRLEAIRREFVTNVSHELKTPLTAIRGFAETLLDDDHIDEAVRLRFLTRIRDQAIRLSSLVADLLALSRVEAEDEGLERLALDLRDPLEASVARFSADAELRRLDFQVAVPGAPVPVCGDREALEQVVDNLLSNAFKNTGDDGSIRVNLERQGNCARIEVTDTGIGIETQHLERIFERFYRVDRARSRELGGTGLGLSIVKHIVKAHGGEVFAESQSGCGSTFRVDLPLHLDD